MEYASPAVPAAVAFLVNIPLGMIRERSQKFSLPWFFWIHASIPLIIFLRLRLGVSPVWIPVFIACAVAGQILGSRRIRNFRTESQADQYERIPDLSFSNPGRPSVSGKEGDRNIQIVLTNMGGPRTNGDVKPFLRRLFSDPLLIRFPLPFLLQPLLARLIVWLRGEKAEQRYGLIGGGSPIYPSTEAQTAALARELQRRGRDLSVTYAFNYSDPDSRKAVDLAVRQGRTHILALSLYPHYSSSTTGSSLNALRCAASQNKNLRIRPAPGYHLHPGYIRAFADRICEAVGTEENLNDFYLVFSAHGIPLYLLNEGDPYPYQVAQTVGAILGRLNRRRDWIISYQSAVGPLQWLKPSTDAVLKKLAQKGRGKILVVPVSFVSDHIETICEIDIEYRAMARQGGIKDFRMCRALETHPGFIQALADTVEEALPPPSSVSEKSPLASEVLAKEN